VRGGNTQVIEIGTPVRFVVIAFESAEVARQRYDSPACTKVKMLRLKSAEVREFLVDGVGSA